MLPLLAVAVAVALAATQSRSVAFTTEAIGEGPVADAAAQRICQDDEVPAGRPFDGVDFFAVNQGRGPARLTVRVLGPGGEARLAGGAATVAPTPPGGPATVRVRLDERIATPGGIRVCIRARRAASPLLLYGSANPRYTDAIGTANGVPFGSRVFLVYTGDDRSPLAELRGMVDRAALFRARWLAPWMLWVLTGLALVALPLLLAVALARSRD